MEGRVAIFIVSLAGSCVCSGTGDTVVVYGMGVEWLFDTES